MARYPGAVWKPLSRNFTPGGRTAQLGLILHVQAGNGELSGWFSNPSAQASSTFWVSKTGTVVQYMQAGTDKSWAQAAGNGQYDSVETEGQPAEALTDAQVTALAALVRWEHDTYGMPYTVISTPGQSGFGWHGMGGSAWGGHTGCPGDLRRAQMQHIIDAAQSGTQEDDMTPDQDRALARILQILEATDVTIHDQEHGTIAQAAATINGRVNQARRKDGTPYLVACQGDVDLILAQLAATNAALQALATSQGLDSTAITQAITDAVDKALADVTITLTAKEN